MTFEQMLEVARNPSATVDELRAMAKHLVNLLGDVGHAGEGIRITKFGEIVTDYPLDCSPKVARNLASVLLRLADRAERTA